MKESSCLRVPGLACVLFYVLVFVGLWGLVPSARALDMVTLSLKFHDQFQFAGYYAAVEKGFYEDEGLEVRLLEYSAALYSVEEVVEGRADFGVSGMELMQARGRGVPVVILAAIFQHSPVVILTKKDCGIREPQDLVGSRVMSGVDDLVEFKAMLKQSGVDVSTVEFVPYTNSVEALLTGRIDASVDYISNEPNQLLQRGGQPHLLHPADYGIDFYGDCLFTSKQYLRKNPALVERFLRASLRGWRYALEHPEEMIDHILKMPSVQERGISREHLRYEAAQIARLANADLVQMGHINPRRVQQIADTLRELHLVPPDFSPGEMIYALPGATERFSRWVFWGALSLAALVGLGFLTALWHYRLRKKVLAKTEELRRAQDQVQRANKAKAEFLATMSHELRTPLNGVLGPISLLQEEEITEEQRHLLRLLRSNAEHLLQLIEDLLDFTGLDAGRIEIRQEAFDLHRLLGDMEAIWKARLSQPQALVFSCKVESGVPRWVKGDALRLRQVLTNLLSNAFKFTSQGLIALRVYPDVTVAERLVFSVRDTGAGIPAADLPFLFQRFTQAKNAPATPRMGVGLGLAISQDLCHLMQGRIEVESREGHGTEFLVSLPLPETHPPSGVSDGAPGGEGQSPA